ncbi:MAG: IS110 family transposase [Rhizobiales bacterium]|nr:IS110 family transposase [Hyphomicrobiales bacterium]
MKTYVGLDVSLKETSICIVDETGTAIRQGVVLSDPDVIAEYLAEHAPTAQRVGLESGPTSSWLWRELDGRGLPAICIDARHASAALSMQINKSDRNDALGLARIMQTGWFRRVQVKSKASHRIRALLNARSLLVQMRRDLENQIRGLFKSFGLVIGRANGGVFLKRAIDVSRQAPELAGIAGPLLDARADIDRQRLELERQIKRLARETGQSRAFMTVPGVGPMTALAFLSGIDDPARFARSRSVGAYLGLTPRRHASGEVDWTGRISKCGDTLLRTYLFEAANVVLTRTKQSCDLKTWGMKVAARSGGKKARVAMARKLATILHRMWCDGTSFKWSTA